ncbi:uncharacterized protein LOC131636746 [Vicia villosa]|uniref:uncharacterized protein LOC131636746 n=1 Tax=Vicia villosa TaxID=3911 RepID=UPI00273BAE3E|nr:uncharacterized protein LOC131636746 [Vicia villosa]
MSRITYFFGTPPVQPRHTSQVSNVRVVETPGNGDGLCIQRQTTERGEEEHLEQNIPRVVQRNQDAEQVLRNVQQNNFMGNNNISNVVEQILVQNGINVGLHRPNFVSPLSEYIRQTELPRGWKVPKFTKFAGETGESTVEHVARFQTEAGDLANNENLKLKYFPSSLTKSAFTWFTTLPPQSVFSWNQLERLFHEQFYMGQSKIILTELADEFDSDNSYDENEINVDELKPGPPYVCKLLTPSNGKNPVEENQNEKFTNKTYTFDITKCDEIFDLLVADGQIIVPPGLKNPPLEQKKKRGYCKFHNFLGHKTSQCVLFRDLVQKALKEGMLQFGGKQKSSMQVDENPMMVGESNYTEVAGIMMVETTKGFDKEKDMATDGQILSMAYPKPPESLLKFLERCHKNNTQVGLCPRCDAVYDVDAAKIVNFGLQEKAV